MALPKLNTPTYELKIPSTGQKVKYRPFLVKEEKILLMALEDGSVTAMSNAMKDIISACTEGEIKIKNLAPFDIEYFFLQLRGKSVGDTVNLSFNKPRSVTCGKKIKDCAEICKIEITNKDGKKYAFVTVSEIASQYELSIFSENLSKYRYLLKEGNLLIFDIDIIINNNEPRYVIRSIKKLENEFDNLEKKIDIFIQSKNLVEYKEHLFSEKKPSKCKISIFINIDNKLINFNLNDIYSVKSYKQLDLLKSSKKLDYNINIS